jgi:serine/threonine protein kinase
MYFIDMELCDISLTQYLSPEAPHVAGLEPWITVPKNVQVSSILEQILRGVSFLHLHSMIHGNLKPQNGKFNTK